MGRTRGKAGGVGGREGGAVVTAVRRAPGSLRPWTHTSARQGRFCLPSGALREQTSPGSSISTRDRPRPAAHKTEAGSLAAGTVADSAALPEMTHSRTSSGAWQEGGRRRRPSRSGARRPPAPAEMPLPLRPPSRVIATLSTSCAIYRQRGVRREGEAAAGVPGRRRGCQNAEGRGPAPPDRHPPGSAFQHPHSHSKVDRNVFI